MPAQPQADSLAWRGCGALSVPRKNLGSPPVSSGDLGEVERHQRLERHTRRQSRQDALAVSQRLLRRSHRRLEIGHDDGARKAARRVGEHRGQNFTIAQVQMPIIGAGEGQARHGRRPFT